MNQEEWAERRDELTTELGNAVMRLLLHDSKVIGTDVEGKLLASQVSGVIGCVRLSSMRTGQSWYTSIVSNASDGEKLGMVDMLQFDMQKRVFTS